MAHAHDRLRVIPFRPELARLFGSINEQWIEAMFAMEASDRALLNTPIESVIEPGGRIWFVEHDTLGIVGTCALMKRGEGIFELTKMGVLESARGAKAGGFLLAAVLAEAEKMQIDLLFLLTNKKCEAAIHLYRKYGFEHDAEILQRFGVAYERCNVAMRWRGWP